MDLSLAILDSNVSEDVNCSLAVICLIYSQLDFLDCMKFQPTVLLDIVLLYNYDVQSAVCHDQCEGMTRAVDFEVSLIYILELLILCHLVP